MQTRHDLPVIKIVIRDANARMGLQAVFASVENNKGIIRRSAEGRLKPQENIFAHVRSTSAEVLFLLQEKKRDMDKRAAII